MDFSHQNPNSNPNYTFFPESVNPMPDFEVSDYLLLDGSIFDDDTSSQSMLSSEKGMAAATELSAFIVEVDCKCKRHHRSIHVQTLWAAALSSSRAHKSHPQ
ncbi:hypothetical protein GOBAR_AA21933 [Gossypium barbadense]|uniref:WRKY domain-containing protein n=1 Tax=Gossypium barbadense TaxID=3634 RepID=A0A2P5X5X4_GOSBA|nr:hypothetical protein GOBAR_AA21933 [Gossypium barbadense]